ncbi:uncharacterized protein LOC122074786 isoform X2 [Macadamia integrifolia]|uniref:uncharacterized protein LOC122074786 isoform X2 n=1 Tax=Macadamia integrifolia TaxID=60698 RepID=UPI001C4E320C|nr:uncharacterized protein LOC122074786 isoform X2 [Macadamia integrifolia]
MAGILNYPSCGRGENSVTNAGRGLGFCSTISIKRRVTTRISMPFEDDIFNSCQLALTHSSKVSKVTRPSIQMALVEERLSCGQKVTKTSEILAYDLVQGALVNWSSVMDKSIPEPPTAVLLHGILGSRKNWGSFARRLAQEFPTWQFLLVDLRCHGDSSSIKKRGPHTVGSTALDVLKLVAHLRVTPRVLIGHSFGGKVALSMVEQAAKPLARPVRVWVLDATPGKVRAGGDQEDHPAELIAFLSRLPKQVSSKRAIVDALIQEGFSVDVAQWVVTNLRQISPPGLSSSSFSWVFDLNGISEMYKSYEETNLWKIVDDVPQGVHVNFLKAERSLHRWALEDLQRIHAAEELAVDEGGGVQMHVLEDAGHWKALGSTYTQFQRHLNCHVAVVGGYAILLLGPC